MSLLVKIRIGLALGIVVAVFLTLGWTFARPLTPDDVLTIRYHHDPWQMAALTAVLCALAPLAAIIAGKSRLLPVGMAAAPAGLAAWAVMNGSFNKLLLASTALDERVSLFRGLAVDTLFWTILVWLGFTMAYFLGGRNPQATETLTLPPTESPAKPKAKSPWEQALRHGLGSLLSLPLAILLLMLFLQSGSTTLDSPALKVMTPPKTAQAIFAIWAAFFLAVLGVHQVIRGSIWFFLAGPPLVALLGYLFAARESVWSPLLQAPPIFIPAAVNLAAVLPLHYLALGSLGVIAGYWTSIRLEASRDHKD